MADESIALPDIMACIADEIAASTSAPARAHGMYFAQVSSQKAGVLAQKSGAA
jgi:hypothetical protein